MIDLTMGFREEGWKNSMDSLGQDFLASFGCTVLQVIPRVSFNTDRGWKALQCFSNIFTCSHRDVLFSIM